MTLILVLYVIILSAALDLVGADTPKGIVAFFNVFPALLAKVAWPLLSNGTIRYGRRVGFCTTVSWLGIVVSYLLFPVPGPKPIFGAKYTDHRFLQLCPSSSARYLPRQPLVGSRRTHLLANDDDIPYP